MTTDGQIPIEKHYRSLQFAKLRKHWPISSVQQLPATQQVQEFLITRGVLPSWNRLCRSQNLLETATHSFT